jgi:glucose-1-phosphate cytidylyltransferase
MDVIILCGGMGSRLSEETIIKPKPMVEIGGKPILWHIMKYYSYYGYNRFVLALGYKGDYIKEYFLNYKLTQSDFTISMDTKSVPFYFNSSKEKEWEITFIDTGLNTLKGARIKRLENFIKSSSFHLTYGDGLANIDLNKLVSFHTKHGKIATVTAVRPPSRFGEMMLNKNSVIGFDEKSQMHTGYINGGFFILNKKILSYLTEDENCDFEFGVIQKIVKEGQLMAYQHDDFWQCMDNVRERDYLNKLIEINQAPWKKW